MGVRVSSLYEWAKQLRLRRLASKEGQRLFIVPLDHTVTNGPIRSATSFRNLVDELADSGVDAVVLHKGRLRQLEPARFRNLGLIVHLSASTELAPDPDAKGLVASVEEALRWGADAVSVHVNLGSRQEREQLADLAAVADACDRWSLPLLAMMYPRGPQIADPRDPALVAHAATVAADLGADLVKSVYTGSVETMADVVRSSPVPIVVAGGAALGGRARLLRYVDEVLRAGVAGVAIGRNIFQAADPAAEARAVAELVHGSSPPVRPSGAPDSHVFGGPGVVGGALAAASARTNH